MYWRSPSHADLVTVEVKLDFTAALVQQASNYRRFSDRVWIAVPIRAEPSGAAAKLRESNQRLFDHVIDLGMGILACRPARGRSYDVFPVHWPKRLVVDPLERDAFVERHRECLEHAAVVPPLDGTGYPRLG